jgi:Fungal chitosanase of glycosyl hydrolase group 75
MPDAARASAVGRRFRLAVRSAKRHATWPLHPTGRVDVGQIGAVTLWRFSDPVTVAFRSGIKIDADGAPDAYHPAGKGRDFLGNAGKPGNWWALVTDNGQKDGTPIVQGPNEPAPGYFVSTTALQDKMRARTDPRRYVDSATVPYISLPGGFGHGMTLGDLAAVYNERNRQLSFAIFADVGPRNSIGEGSIALAAALGVNADPRHGGERTGIW